MGNAESSTDKIRVIACVGPTGCGKSRIIDCLARTDWASDSLKGGARIVRSAEITVDGNTVVLIDTPGFDGFEVLPSDTVLELQRWLKKKYNEKVNLTGIIYLHPISDNRMTKVSPLDLKNLLNPDASRVVLVTTMWDMTPQEVAEGRETQLRTVYWKDMLDLGARTGRFDNRVETAWQIINQLLARNHPGTSRFRNSSPSDKNRETTASGSKAQNNRWRNPFSKVRTEDLSSKDVVIGVMGPTGSGKSSFIELASGINGIVGHSLESCTDEISVIKFSIPELLDSEIFLVDTPGFDTNKSDVDVFRTVSDWLNDTYKRDIKLAGLLYFHRITDNRMAGTPLKNLLLFEKLCGKEFSTIVLTTTMWDEVDFEIGEQREQELKDNYWKVMINRGSTVKRFLSTQESALDVLRPILTRLNETHTLSLQREVTDLGLKLQETSAGRVLSLRLEELVPKQQSLLAAIRNDLMDSKLQPGQLERLHQSYQEVSAELQRLMKDVERMKISLGEQLNFVRTHNWKGSRFWSAFRSNRERQPARSRATPLLPPIATGKPLTSAEKIGAEEIVKGNATNERPGGDAGCLTRNWTSPSLIPSLDLGPIPTFS